jgi:hypothetical protein
MSMAKFQMFQTVRLVKIPERDARVIIHNSFRAPKLGDTGAVIEIFSEPREHYFVEAVTPDGGCDWILDLFPDELELSEDFPT